MTKVINDNLRVGGTVDLDSTLNVDGAVNIEGATVVDDTLNATGAVDFDGALNVQGAVDFDSTLNVDSYIRAGHGIYTFSSRVQAGSNNYLQVAITRAAGANQFGGLTFIVGMQSRISTTYRRGCVLVQVNSTNGTAMPWVATALAAGITVTATTDTDVNLTLKFDLGATGHNDLLADFLVLGAIQPTITVVPSMIV